MSYFFVDKNRNIRYTFYSGDDTVKKGFTLVELLAVLIILSLIAVISIPIVANVIEKGRTGAIQNSVEFYITEIEKAYAEWAIEGVPSGLTVTQTGEYDQFDASQLNTVLKIKGTKPLSGTVSVNRNYMDETSLYGFVVSAKLSYEGDYEATYTYDINSDSKNKKNISIVKK